ncbi:MAG: polymer-forming cytoskeletal protein [bacterium]|nr:polymer-forming cytoskeletal protein [bacterium]
MILGKKDDNNRREIKMKEDGSLNTIVGRGSTISGNLDIQGSIRVDGTVKGEVKCSDLLTVGPGGRIEGEVNVKHIVLGGTVSGNISGSEKVELQNKSVVEGDVTTKSLTVEAGAVFHGKCSMKDGAKPVVAPPPPQMAEKDKK